MKRQVRLIKEENIEVKNKVQKYIYDAMNHKKKGEKKKMLLNPKYLAKQNKKNPINPTWERAAATKSFTRS